MNTELTLNALQSMNAQEYEEIRAAGSDMRRNLTHEVMREVDAPANWMMNGEYGSEFGGFFPVQVRFTPAHERFHLALCSPGAEKMKKGDAAEHAEHHMKDNCWVPGWMCAPHPQTDTTERTDNLADAA